MSDRWKKRLIAFALGATLLVAGMRLLPIPAASADGPPPFPTITIECEPMSGQGGC
jgi:hypothetical protein